MRREPWWPGLVAVAHTLPYDLAVMGNGGPPAELARITAPTLALDGAESDPWGGEAAAAVAAAVPGARRVTVPGQTHEVDESVLAPYLVDFFA